DPPVLKVKPSCSFSTRARTISLPSSPRTRGPIRRGLSIRTRRCNEGFEAANARGYGSPRRVRNCALGGDDARRTVCFHRRRDEPSSGPRLFLLRLLAADRLQLGEHGVDVEVVALLLGRLEFRLLAGGLGGRQQGGAAVGGVGRLLLGRALHLEIAV